MICRIYRTFETISDKHPMTDLLSLRPRSKDTTPKKLWNLATLQNQRNGGTAIFFEEILNKLIFMFLAIFGEKFQKIVKWVLWSWRGENLAARKRFGRKSLKQNISLFPKLVEAFTNPFSYLAAFLSLFLTLINTQSAN